MTQNELNRAVAEATGETVSEICSRGFSLLNLRPIGTEPATRHRGRRRRGQRRGRKRHREPVYLETE
jgi:hypothetical protein